MSYQIHKQDQERREMMLWMRKILMFIRWPRALWLKSEKRKLQEWRIVDEDKSRFCIRIFRRVGLFHGSWDDAWIRKGDMHIYGVRWSLWPLKVLGIIGLMAWAVLFALAFGEDLIEGNLSPTVTFGLTGLALLIGSAVLLERTNKIEGKRERVRKFYEMKGLL